MIPSTRRLPTFLLVLLALLWAGSGAASAASSLPAQEDGAPVAADGAGEGASAAADSAAEGAAAAVEAAAAGAAEAASEAAEDAGADGKGWMDRIDAKMQAVNQSVADVIFYPIPIPFTVADSPTELPFTGGAKTEKQTIRFAVLWLIIGALIFTVRMGFVQLRMVPHAIQITRGKYDEGDDEGEVSHFEALSAALSATVGLGNIAGVALAISLGGPGATFWMIVAGLLGMASKFTECTLGQIYRHERSDGSVMGGAMYYLSDGLKERGLGFLGKPLAIVFAILCIGGSMAGGNSFQVNQSLGAIEGVAPFLGDYPWVYGIVMTTAVGIVILGGLRRIADVASAVVPTMCGIYVLACLYILFMARDEIGPAFGTIIDGAFTPEAGLGGALGVLIVGFQRAAFSNEAGVGSAAIAHSAAKTKYPVREGIVALLEPLIDTVIICTMTALVIVISQGYLKVDPETGLDTIYRPFIESDNGAGLTLAAFQSEIGDWFGYVLAVAVALFAFSTMISWSYYGERCFAWLFGDGLGIVYKVLFLAFTFIGSVVTGTAVLEFGDLMILGMAIPNVIGVVLLSGKVKEHLSEYLELKRTGQM
ncbi:MAG: alanine/glycine:cation symporter family protein [Planctomycetota bacterium]